MPIPSMKLKGEEHYKVYTSGGASGMATKAELGRRGLAEALRLGSHDPRRIVDFIPIEFTINLHGWGDFKFKGLKAIKSFVMTHINDPKLEEKLGGKLHFDLRHQKLKSPSWFGSTHFRPPWQGTADDKVQGLWKGTMQLLAPGRKLRAEIQKKHGLTPTAKTTVESGSPNWMTEEYYISPGQAYTSNRFPEVMIIIEKRMPGVLHRRDFDFLDATYLGRYMKGRYYHRLVARTLKPEELPKTYEPKRKAKEYVYTWRAKNEDQFPENIMWDVAAGNLKLMPRSLTETKGKL